MAKTNKRGIIKVEVDVFPLTLFVLVNLTNAEAGKFLKKLNIAPEDIEAMNLGTLEVGKSNIYDLSTGVIRINRKLHTPEFHDTMAHELVHIVSPFMNAIGMKLDQYSEEAYAYLTGFLTKKIYQQL